MADESRGTIIVPLLFRFGSCGRTGTVACIGWSTEEPDDESDQPGLAALFGLASPIMLQKVSNAAGYRAGSVVSVKVVNGRGEGSNNKERAMS
jgi:hypothetical protein